MKMLARAALWLSALLAVASPLQAQVDPNVTGRVFAGTVRSGDLIDVRQADGAKVTTAGGLISGSFSGTMSERIALQSVTIGQAILPPSNGVDDTATINGYLAALAFTGKTLGCTAGQNYLVTAPVVVWSVQTLNMTGCTVTLKPGSNKNILVNRSAVVAAKSVTDGAMTATQTTLTSATANFSAADVGRSVVVDGAGQPTGFTGIGPLVSRVVSVSSATQVVLADPAVTTVSGSATGLYDRDNNITITGGTWDHGTNGGTGLDRMSLRFRRVDGFTLSNTKLISTSSGKYALHLADFTKFRSTGVDLNTSSDGLHLLGPGRDFVIENTTGYSGDDFIALGTSDYDAPGSSYSDSMGSITDGVISGFFPRLGAARGVLGFSSPGYSLKRITFEKGRGSVAAAIVQLSNSNEDMTIRDMKPESHGATLIQLQADLNTSIMRNMVIEDVAMDWAGAGKTALVGVSTALPLGLTVNSMSISKVRLRGTATTYRLLNVVDATIDALNIDDQYVRMGAGGDIVYLQGLAASIGRLTLTKLDTNAGNILNASATATITGDTNSNNTITNVVGTVYAGQPISGPGIPVATRIGTVSGTTITLIGPTGAAANATATANVTLTITQRLPSVTLADVKADGASRLFYLATNTKLTYKGLSFSNAINGLYGALAPAVIEVRGTGFDGTGIGNPVIVSGGIVSVLAQDWPLTTQAGGVPVVSSIGNLGSTGSATIVGSDRRGILTLTPGGTSIAAGTQAIVTFTRAIGTNPVPILTPLNAAAAASGAYINGANTTNFTVTAPNALGSVAIFGYEVGRAGARMELPRWWRGRGILPSPANDQKADELAA